MSYLNIGGGYAEVAPWTNEDVRDSVLLHIPVAIEGKKLRVAFEGTDEHVPTAEEAITDFLKCEAGRAGARKFDAS